MTSFRCVMIFVLLVFLAGCASARDKKLIKNLEKELAFVTGKFALTKEENLTLRREITLFKKYQDVDIQRFIRALDVFEKELADEIAKNDVWVSLSDRGLVITVLAEKLYVTGTEALEDSGKAFLDKICDLIQKILPYHYIYIEGHTDNQSLAVFEWKSDWDFSFARALGILKYFSEKKHIEPLRLSASGFGQYRPLQTNETKEGRRMNRRIEIIISPQRLKHSVPDKKNSDGKLRQQDT